MLLEADGVSDGGRILARVEVMALTPTTAFDPPDKLLRIGLILLSTDATTEADFQRLVAGGRVAVHASRVAFDNPTTAESLARTAPRLTAAAAQLLPGTAFRAIYFACTSAASVIGEAGVAAAIDAGKPAKTTVLTPISAAGAALAALGARRISLLAPYTVELTRQVAATFEAMGLTLDRVTCWDIADDRDMGRVTPEAIAAAAPAAMAPGSDALFISCTALRAAGVAARIEAVLGRPVITSNLAAAWACRRLAGLTDAPLAGSRLFTLPYPHLPEVSDA